MSDITATAQTARLDGGEVVVGKDEEPVICYWFPCCRVNLWVAAFRERLHCPLCSEAHEPKWVNDERAT